MPGPRARRKWWVPTDLAAKFESRRFLFRRFFRTRLYVFQHQRVDATARYDEFIGVLKGKTQRATSFVSLTISQVRERHETSKPNEIILDRNSNNTRTFLVDRSRLLHETIDKIRTEIPRICVRSFARFEIDHFFCSKFRLAVS